MAELCLGTVQFGMKYGINNTLGQPTKEEVFEMLDAALGGGISVIDTASAYGTAEAILGEYFSFRKKEDALQIISKLRPNVIKSEKKDVLGQIQKECESSLERLRMSYLDGYLLHTPQYIYNPDILKALRKLKEQKLIKHVGISIYDLEDGYTALGAEEIDYIQLPYSILDQRGIQEGFIREAKQTGRTVFTRSAFLQGLFMMEKERIPMNLQHVIPYFEKLDMLLEKYAVSRIEALIHFVVSEPDIDYMVFGVDTKEQLLQDIETYQGVGIPRECIAELKNLFMNIEKSIIFPSLWSSRK